MPGKAGIRTFQGIDSLPFSLLQNKTPREVRTPREAVQTTGQSNLMGDTGIEVANPNTDAS